MGIANITDEQVEAFGRDGSVTVDTPLTTQTLDAASRLMDERLSLSSDKRNPPGSVPQRFRIKQNQTLDPPFVRIVEEPFLERLAQRLLHTDSVILKEASLRNTYPQPGAQCEMTEHTDMTLSLSDLESRPRRMSVGLFVWISDVDEQCAPLMIRPGSHRQIAQFMGDNPRYIHGPWKQEEFVNVPDASSLPVGIGTFPDQWPDLEYADPVACVARAGQVTAVNPATIHGASTNVGRTNRKTLIIGMQPKSIELGETKQRHEGRVEYLRRIRNVLSPHRRHIALGC